MDGPDEVGHAAEGPPANPLPGDFSKPALDKVQPGSAGRCEVQVVTGMGGEPVLHGGMFVRAVVVENQMDGAALGRVAFDPLEKREELRVAVTGHAGTDHLPAEGAEG